jgi:hypothetical protein
MKPDCQNEECIHRDVECVGSCGRHIHLDCDKYIDVKPFKDKLESCRSATIYLNDMNNSTPNANKLRAIKKALDACHTAIAGDDMGTDDVTREIVANRTLRRFLEDNL